MAEPMEFPGPCGLTLKAIQNKIPWGYLKELKMQATDFSPQALVLFLNLHSGIQC